MRFSFLILALPLSIIGLQSASAVEGDPTAGATVFAKCKACHVADTDQNRVGPTLHHVVDRPAATVPDYNYSPAMKEAGGGGLVWDEATLTTYLANPREMVKGTKMAFPGLKKEDDIANVIAYLKQVGE